MALIVGISGLWSFRRRRNNGVGFDGGEAIVISNRRGTTAVPAESIKRIEWWTGPRHPYLVQPNTPWGSTVIVYTDENKKVSSGDILITPQQRERAEIRVKAFADRHRIPLDVR